MSRDYFLEGRMVSAVVSAEPWYLVIEALIRAMSANSARSASNMARTKDRYLASWALAAFVIRLI